MSSVIFFAFFSFGEDAMREYRECWIWVRRTVFRQDIGRDDKKGMWELDSECASPTSYTRYVPVPSTQRAN